MQNLLLELELYRRSKRAFWLMCFAAGLDAFILASSLDALQSANERQMVAGAPLAAFALAFLVPKSAFSKPARALLAGLCCGALAFLALAWLGSISERGVDQAMLLGASAALGAAWGLICHGFDRDEPEAGRSRQSAPSVALAGLTASTDMIEKVALGAAAGCWPQWSARCEPGQEGLGSLSIDMAPEAGFQIVIERLTQEEPTERADEGPQSVSDEREPNSLAEFMASFVAVESSGHHAGLEELRNQWTRKLLSMGVDARALG